MFDIVPPAHGKGERRLAPPTHPSPPLERKSLLFKPHLLTKRFRASRNPTAEVAGRAPPYRGTYVDSSSSSLLAREDLFETPDDITALFARPLFVERGVRYWFDFFQVCILALLCVGVWGIVAYAQGVNSRLRDATSVVPVAGQAFAHLLSAREALVGGDLEKAEAEFARSEIALLELDRQLSAHLGVSRRLFLLLDVTGYVADGEALLKLGQHLTAAGRLAVRSLAVFSEAKFMAEGESAGQPSLIDALVSAQPAAAQAIKELDAAEQLMATVDAASLPAGFQEQWAGLMVGVPTVRETLVFLQEEQRVLLSLLGAEQERNYLLLFQNNHELRPTGGFIGSIGLVNVDHGMIEGVDVKSVYDGDGQLTQFIAPPQPLSHVNNRWYLRDANWFVDYAVSARKIADFLEKERGPTVDGVIAMTPDVIGSLLAITGPISMPEYHVTVDEHNFIPLTQQQVTYEYDRSLNRPKQFMADLTPRILHTLFTAHDGQLGAGLQVLSKMIAEKNILLYFKDDDLQARIEALGWGGRLPAADNLLYLNTANIGGHKSDQFIEQLIEYTLTPLGGGRIEAEVAIYRTHHGPWRDDAYLYPAEENPARKDNIVYQRLFVPRDTDLVSASGFNPVSAVRQFVNPDPNLLLTPDVDVVRWQGEQTRHVSGTTIGRESGYTFLGNWMITKPGQTTVGKYRFQFTQPFSRARLWDEYLGLRLALVKQPGDPHTNIRVRMRVPEGATHVLSYPEGMTANEEHEVVYEAYLNRDMVIGIIYRKKS